MLLENFLKSIGKNIVRHRKAAALNQVEVASKAGFSYRYYQKIESGGANMTLSTLYRLARFFDVHPEDLIPRKFD
ncbi:MAG: helix-turn-helix transcriptional regulator [Bdellovibrionota bacterium]